MRIKEYLDEKVSYMISGSQREGVDRLVNKQGFRGDSDFFRELLHQYLIENDAQYRKLHDA